MTLTALVLLLAGVVEITNAPAGWLEQAHVDALWGYVQTLTGMSAKEGPEVYFTAEEEPAPSSVFLAYYYDRTRVIRINTPEIRRHAVIAQPGMAYQVIGHESIHYLLYKAGVRLPAHHCLMATLGYAKAVDGWLLEQGLLTPLTLGAMQQDPVRVCRLLEEFDGNER